MSKRLTKEEIINRIKSVHHDKYDYSLFLSDDFKYERITDVIPIICHEHGIFWQSLANHLQGKGCSKCANEYSPTTEEFIELAKKVHGNKYDYSKTKYVNSKTDITIICPIHGEFKQVPQKHLNGRGCQKCGGTQRKTTKEFIDAVIKVHGNKYDCSEVKYINNKTNVSLICPIHGKFSNTPHNIICGKQGCPKCNKSKLENEISLYLSLNGIEFEEQKKFSWLKNYELDFYLPKYNVAIECQGRQHFEAVKMFGGDEQFKKQVAWDDEKNALCNEHGIMVLYFTKGEFKNGNPNYRYKLFSRKKELLNEIKKWQLIETN